MARGEIPLGIRLKHVTPQIRDMQMAAGLVLANIEKDDQAVHTLSELPAVKLPEDYYQNQLPARNVLAALTDQGRNLTLHLVDLWNRHRGFECDQFACDLYPELYPGAHSFCALMNEFRGLSRQLPLEDQEKLAELYSISVASGPRAILELLPAPSK